MSRIAAFLLVLTLTACSRPEPASASAAPADATAHTRRVPQTTPEPQPSVIPSPAQDPSGTAPAAPSIPGTTSEQAPTPAAPPATPAPDGAALFASTCATCHMADGSGVPFLQPSIKGSAWISNPDPQLLLSLILRGSAVLGEAAKAYDNDMAPQEHLTDAEVAAVATYVRTRFAAPPVAQLVTPAEVATARARPGLPP